MWACCLALAITSGLILLYPREYQHIWIICRLNNKGLKLIFSSWLKFIEIYFYKNSWAVLQRLYKIREWNRSNGHFSSLCIPGSQSFLQIADHAHGICRWTTGNATLRFLHSAEDMGGTTCKRKQKSNWFSLVSFMSMKKFYISLLLLLHQFLIWFSLFYDHFSSK